MRNKLAVVAITLAVALLFSTAPAKAGKPTTTVVPVDILLSNQCTGEDVNLTGTLTFWSDTDIKNGIAHIRIHTILDLSGVGGTSGNNYSFHSVQNFASNVKADGTSGEFNTVLNETFISQSGADNLRVHGSVHVTVNANGDVTVERTDVDIECVG